MTLRMPITSNIWASTWYVGPGSLRGVLLKLTNSQVSKLLQEHLGERYDPERDWTSWNRGISGYQPHERGNRRPGAEFTLRGTPTRERLTKLLLKHGHSRTPGWRNCLRMRQPIYHVDVVVSPGSKFSTFALPTSTLERVS